MVIDFVEGSRARDADVRFTPNKVVRTIGDDVPIQDVPL